jgi:hypothetical protein
LLPVLVLIILVVSIPIIVVFALLLKIMGSVARAKNYKKESLLSAVLELFRTGVYSWDQVATLYTRKSNEAELQDRDDVKRQWTKRTCKKLKKPTDKADAANDFILCCQRVQPQIMRKCESSLIGGEDSAGDDSDSGVEEAGGRNMGMA